MSLASDTSVTYPVFLGTWTNWSRGPVLGSTLTVSRENGNLLIAFIAFFVAFVGSRLWRILCLALHSVGASQDPRDGPHHQKQAVFRNAGSAASGLWSFFQILLAWRSVSPHVWQTILPALAAAVLCTLGFSVASVFSSQISSSTGDDVLLLGSNCAWVDISEEATLSEIASVWGPYHAQTWVTSANYAHDCYLSGSSGFVQCGTFPVNKLPLTVTSNATCPFAEGMCRTNDSNIIVDSGLLDSRDHFGLNAPENHRMQWRMVMHCAPLVTEGYKADMNDTASRPVTRYYYGPTTNIYTGEKNFTYEYVNERYWNFNISQTDYVLG